MPSQKLWNLTKHPLLLLNPKKKHPFLLYILSIPTHQTLLTNIRIPNIIPNHRYIHSFLQNSSKNFFSIFFHSFNNSVRTRLSRKKPYLHPWLLNQIQKIYQIPFTNRFYQRCYPFMFHIQISLTLFYQKLQQVSSTSPSSIYKQRSSLTTYN